MKSFLFISILAMTLVGCAPTPVAEADAKPAAPTTTGEPVAYRNAEGKLLCPVMGSVIASEADAVGFQDYEGKRYYICCGTCMPKFKANPAQYAKK